MRRAARASSRKRRAASALEHPHIAVIHEIGEAEGVSFIAMELIRGDKLSDVVARGALRPDRALDVAIEIAEAQPVAAGRARGQARRRRRRILPAVGGEVEERRSRPRRRPACAGQPRTPGVLKLEPPFAQL
jgi:hypothetical protein